MANPDDMVRRSGRLLMPTDLADVPSPNERDPTMPDPPVMSAQDAAKALCELFLTNAERGNHAVNDELVAELVHRIRAQQQSRHNPNNPPRPGHPTNTTPTGGDHYDLLDGPNPGLRSIW